jgi:hypothetical protein
MSGHIPAIVTIRARLPAFCFPSPYHRKGEEMATVGKKKTAGKRTKRTTKRWSADVTTHSDALDLDRSVFTWKDPKRIARSLKHSAEVSRRRKSDPYRSAMSMLTFYINRAGDNLGPTQHRVLERAKAELRRSFGKEGPASPRKASTRKRSSTKRARR